MPALGVNCQLGSLVTPSFIHAIIFQQPLMNEDLRSPSKNIASALVDSYTFLIFDVCATYCKSFNFKHERDRDLHVRIS